MEAFFTKKWDAYLSFFSNAKKDVYFEENYVKLYESSSEKAYCFVCIEGPNYLLYPFLRRVFNYKGVTYFDFETPYGYGGPIANTEDKCFIESALKEFVRECRKGNYVAGFTRFHPLLNNYMFFESIGKLMKDRQTVAVDIRGDIEEIWLKEIHTKNRNVIKKGEKSDLEFVVDYDFVYLDDFIALYDQTMDKLHADDFYYFDTGYYKKFISTIPNRFLGIVFLHGLIVASAIFFYSAEYAHYHLASSSLNYLKYSPNNFLLWNVVKELHKKGVSFFHLGGGTNSDEHNSLLEFKSKFSRSRYDFYIGKLIFNDKIYSELCNTWMNAYPEKVEKYKYYLLKYKY